MYARVVVNQTLEDTNKHLTQDTASGESEADLRRDQIRCAVADLIIGTPNLGDVMLHSATSHPPFQVRIHSLQEGDFNNSHRHVLARTVRCQ
jgi:hypothetical protein